MVTAHQVSRMIGVAYDRANSPRRKREKWVGIAETMELCHSCRAYGTRLPADVERWLSNAAKDLLFGQQPDVHVNP